VAESGDAARFARLWRAGRLAVAFLRPRHEGDHDRRPPAHSPLSPCQYSERYEAVVPITAALSLFDPRRLPWLGAGQLEVRRGEWDGHEAANLAAPMPTVQASQHQAQITCRNSTDFRPPRSQPRPALADAVHGQGLGSGLAPHHLRAAQPAALSVTERRCAVPDADGGRHRRLGDRPVLDSGRRARHESPRPASRCGLATRTSVAAG
jgi:hypothetical protein